MCVGTNIAEILLVVGISGNEQYVGGADANASANVLNIINVRVSADFRTINRICDQAPPLS